MPDWPSAKMMSRLTYAVLVLAVVFYPSMGRTGLFGPSTYDECITESMKGVSSDVAARAIISSCRNQFPERQEFVPEQGEVVPERGEITSGPGRSLTTEELRKLTAKAFVFAGSYRITFHNENEHLTITEVTIAVGDKSDPDGFRRYRQNVRIAPLGSGTAKYTVIYEGDEFNWAWNVAAARGIE